MRQHYIFAFLLVGSKVLGQCGPYKAHPVWPDALGAAYVVPGDCGSGQEITAALWDNGETSWATDGLTVGTHTVVLYAGAEPVEQLTFEIEQLAWELNQNVHMYAGDVAVSVYAEVPYCPGLLFNGHHCPVQSDSTIIQLLQDGVVIDSVIQVSCLGMSHEWNGLPWGHVYQTLLVDRSTCGAYAAGEEVQTYSLEEASFILSTDPVVLGADGSLTVSAVVPDPEDPTSPPVPLSGSLQLLTWPDNVEPIGAPQSGTSGSWVDLEQGQYLLSFLPDNLCGPLDSVITIALSTRVDENDTDTDIRIWPVPAMDRIRWSNSVPTQAWITDQQGRILRSTDRALEMDIAGLPAGAYLLHIEGGIHRRFMKE